jgi:hypothetical protein
MKPADWRRRLDQRYRFEWHHCWFLNHISNEPALVAG